MAGAIKAGTPGSKTADLLNNLVTDISGEMEMTDKIALLELQVKDYKLESKKFENLWELTKEEFDELEALNGVNEHDINQLNFTIKKLESENKTLTDKNVSLESCFLLLSHISNYLKLDFEPILKEILEEQNNDIQGNLVSQFLTQNLSLPSLGKESELIVNKLIEEPNGNENNTFETPVIEEVVLRSMNGSDIDLSPCFTVSLDAADTLANSIPKDPINQAKVFSLPSLGNTDFQIYENNIKSSEGEDSTAERIFQAKSVPTSRKQSQNTDLQVEKKKKKRKRRNKKGVKSSK